MPKNALFLLKNCKNRRALGDHTPLPLVAESFAPRPLLTLLTSRDWGLSRHTPALAPVV